MSTDRKDLGNYGFRGNSGGQGSTFSSAKPGSSAEIMPTGMGAAINVAEVVNRTNEALLTCPFTGCRELVSAAGGQWR